MCLALCLGPQPHPSQLMCPVLRAATVLEGHVVFSTEESSPFDVAVVELEESVLGFVPPRPADTFRTGKRVGEHAGCWGVGSPPIHPPAFLPPQEKR